MHELYRHCGIYWYDRGFNWRAFASFALGFAPLLPGFAKSIRPALDVGGAWKIYTFAWLFGFAVSTLGYYVICTYVSGPSGAMVEEAVYPPQLGEASPVSVEGEEAEEERKEAHVAHERELGSPV